MISIQKCLALLFINIAKHYAFGVDIAIKSNVIQFKPKVRVIKLGPVSIPDWYELPQAEDLKDGAYH